MKYVEVRTGPTAESGRSRLELGSWRDDSMTDSKHRLEKDHTGDEIPVNENTAYSIYAYKVDCPHCGVPEGEHCVETAHKGPVGGHLRSPHQERAELAREVFDE